MLELKNLSFTITSDDEETSILHNITLTAKKPHFMAIVGPSGCGKSTLLKAMAGIEEHTEGNIFWNHRDLEEEGDLEPTEVAYVPQFSIAYDPLTIGESVLTATRLRVRGRSRRIHAITKNALQQAGLWDIRNRQVEVLSGGQKRRLSLAMELVANPDLLLADEVTSGLDPKSENEITHLLHRLSRQGEGRLIINVTHSLSGLELYDSVLVLFAGHIAYHGPARALKHYFSVASAEDVYPQLATRQAESWGSSWEKNRQAYYGLITRDMEKEKAGEQVETTEDSEAITSQLIKARSGSPATVSLSEASKKSLDDSRTTASSKSPEDRAERDQDEETSDHADDPEHDEEDDTLEEDEEDSPETIAELINAPVRTPGLIVQTCILLARRWKIFFRDRTQLILHAAMLLGFPILVAVFALQGIGQPQSSSLKRGVDIAAEVQEQIRVSETNMEIGGLVSGLIMFQVILLSLMGSNNSAREIAGERQIFEKEKFAGLQPSSYLLSKVLFLAVLVVAQAFWMAVFVEMMTQGLPGDFAVRLLLLLLVNAAMTAICLAISALLRSPEQASLLSIYFVGFQLPLSGAILALPTWLEPVIQPFVAAFWGWSGSLSSMEETKFYDAVKSVTETRILSTDMCLYVLLSHLAIGLIAAFIGCRQDRWSR